MKKTKLDSKKMIQKLRRMFPSTHFNENTQHFQDADNDWYPWNDKKVLDCVADEFEAGLFSRNLLKECNEVYTKVMIQR